jgi:hypothetical protein
MAFERVTCEVYFIINTYEVYSEHRSTREFGGMEFESLLDADRALVEDDWIRDEPRFIGTSWKKGYSYAYVTRHLKEVKE